MLMYKVARKNVVLAYFTIRGDAIKYYNAMNRLFNFDGLVYFSEFVVNEEV